METFTRVSTYRYKSDTSGKDYSLWAEGLDQDGNIVKPFLCLTILNYDPAPIRIAAIPRETPCLLCNNTFRLGDPNYIPEFEKVNA